MFGGMSHRSGGAGGIGSGYSTPQTPDYEKIGPTRILPHLYIGCAKDALSLETREVCTEYNFYDAMSTPQVASLSLLLNSVLYTQNSVIFFATSFFQD